LIIRHERKLEDAFSLHAAEQNPCLVQSKSVLWHLRKYPHKPKFRDRTRYQFFAASNSQGPDPASQLFVKHMIEESE
jgi:hypothetical protein